MNNKIQELQELINIKNTQGQKTQELLQKYAMHESDTGSSFRQIILLTERIKVTSGQHLAKHKKDHPAARSIVRWVAIRHKHQRYLTRTLKGKSERYVTYQSMIRDLGLREKA